MKKCLNKDNDKLFKRSESNLKDKSGIKLTDKYTVLINGEELMPKNLNIILNKRGDEHKEALKKALQQRYLIEERLAEAWIQEYYVYLVIRAGKKEDIIPPICVEQTWYTHMEFTAEYRKFIVKVFGSKDRQLLPHPIDVTESTVNKLKKMYENAIEERERISGDLMKPGIWDEKENRFLESISSHVQINRFRLAAAFVLKHKDPDTFGFKGTNVKIEKDNIEYAGNQTQLTAQEREAAEDRKELFAWRPSYPHQFGVGDPYLMENKEEMKFAKETEEERKHREGMEAARASCSIYFNNKITNVKFNLCPVFENGGPLFIPNPHSADALNKPDICAYIISNMYKCCKMRYVDHISVDDLADAALEYEKSKTEKIKIKPNNLVAKNKKELTNGHN